MVGRGDSPAPVAAASAPLMSLLLLRTREEGEWGSGRRLPPRPDRERDRAPNDSTTLGAMPIDAEGLAASPRADWLLSR